MEAREGQLSHETADPRAYVCVVSGMFRRQTCPWRSNHERGGGDTVSEADTTLLRSCYCCIKLSRRRVLLSVLLIQVFLFMKRSARETALPTPQPSHINYLSRLPVKQFPPKEAYSIQHTGRTEWHNTLGAVIQLGRQKKFDTIFRNIGSRTKRRYLIFSIIPSTDVLRMTYDILKKTNINMIYFFDMFPILFKNRIQYPHSTKNEYLHSTKNAAWYILTFTNFY